MPRSVQRPRSARPPRPLVVVLTASMGAGHRQVSTELAARLGRRGVSTMVVDVSELLPAGWGHALTSSYKFMAYRAQPLYEMIFRLQMCSRRHEATLWPLSGPAERRLSGLVERHRPALVLSTFHLCSQIAGRMRAAGALGVPVVSYVLDFFVHGMWAHPGADANLLLHRSQVPRLLAAGARSPVVCGPVVRDAFLVTGTAGERSVGGWPRSEARRSLGIGDNQCCVLVVAGSWGVGDVAGTLRTLMEEVPGALPVVTTGHNQRLRAAAEALARPEGSQRRALVFGWAEDMDRLMAAADVVVENAGGLTAMEAMAAGVPVVTYAPIAGHGKANAGEMARAGVSVYAHDRAELVAGINALASPSPLRRHLVDEARRMFGTDAAQYLSAWAWAGSVGGPVAPAPPPSGPPPHHRVGEERAGHLAAFHVGA
jgi:UDP-N-acetylglucosamine:LPS N-acetylglucosamine transferase